MADRLVVGSGPSGSTTLPPAAGGGSATPHPDVGLYSEDKQERLQQMQHWHAEAMQRRPAVLAQHGAQFAAALGLDFPFALEDVVYAASVRSSSDDEDAREPNRKVFETLMRVATNDPRATFLNLEFDDQSVWLYSSVDLLMACVATALLGNSFVHHFFLPLRGHQHMWASVTSDTFEHLLAAVRQSSLVSFTVPGQSFFNDPDIMGPPADNPGIYDLAAAARAAALGRATTMNAIGIIATNRASLHLDSTAQYFDGLDPGPIDWEHFKTQASEWTCFNSTKSVEGMISEMLDHFRDIATRVSLNYIDDDVMQRLSEAIVGNTRLREITTLCSEQESSKYLTDENVASLVAALPQCNAAAC